MTAEAAMTTTKNVDEKEALRCTTYQKIYNLQET
jgi:hypothetical protein